MSLTTALIAGINALSAAVVFLFFWFSASYKRIEKILGQRDQERAKLWKRIAKLERWAGMMRRCPAVTCPYKEEQDDDDDENEDQDDSGSGYQG